MKFWLDKNKHVVPELQRTSKMYWATSKNIWLNVQMKKCQKYISNHSKKVYVLVQT